MGNDAVIRVESCFVIGHADVNMRTGNTACGEQRVPRHAAGDTLISAGRIRIHVERHVLGGDFNMETPEPQFTLRFCEDGIIAFELCTQIIDVARWTGALFKLARGEFVPETSEIGECCEYAWREGSNPPVVIE